MSAARMRTHFFAELLKGLKVAWPILFALVGAMLATGFVVCRLVTAVGVHALDSTWRRQEMETNSGKKPD